MVSTVGRPVSAAGGAGGVQAVAAARAAAAARAPTPRAKPVKPQPSPMFGTPNYYHRPAGSQCGQVCAAGGSTAPPPRPHAGADVATGAPWVQAGCFRDPQLWGAGSASPLAAALRRSA
ncbi:hypothetical protein GCM10027570_27360 [Streptomonospora sediminis]